MIVIGVDTHKRSHTLVALDAATGVARGQLAIPTSDEGTLEPLRFAAELDDEAGGRSRTAGTSPVAWSERGSLAVSG